MRSANSLCSLRAAARTLISPRCARIMQHQRRIAHRSAGSLAAPALAGMFINVSGASLLRVTSPRAAPQRLFSAAAAANAGGCALLLA